METRRENINQVKQEISYLKRRERYAPKPLPKTRPRALSLGALTAESEEVSPRTVEEKDGNVEQEKDGQGREARRPSIIDNIKKKARRQSTVDSVKQAPTRQPTLESLENKPRRASTVDKLKSKFRKEEPIVVDQLDKSILWKLPLELRTTIWKYALGGNYIHILKKKGRLGHAYCPAEHPEEFERMDKCSYPKDHGYSVSTVFPVRTKPLGLISSCRQIYSETIDILYSHNTFAFDDLDALNWFGSTVLPQRKNRMSVLHLDYQLVGGYQVFHPQLPPFDTQTWLDACNVLASMPHLRELRILANSANGYTGTALNIYPIFPKFLDDLCSISIAGTFDVYLSWPSEHPAENKLVPKKTPYRIKRLKKELTADHVEFRIPFTVQCLHCEEYTEIKKDYRGAAKRFKPEHGATVAELWTFHSYCNGWIAFSVDSMGNWDVIQGAKKVLKTVA